jgi:hypothetical protein
MPIRLRWLSAAALSLTVPGCGEGLISMENLDDLTGFEEMEMPEAPAWVVRWMLEDDWIDGEAWPVWEEDLYVEFYEGDDTSYTYLDFIEVLAPELGEPPPEAIRGHGSEYLFALGVPMLLEDRDFDGAYHPPVPGDLEDLWGAAPFSALLWVDGNLEVFVDQQPVGLEMYSADCDCGFSLEHGLQRVMVEPDLLGLWWELDEIQDGMTDDEWYAEMRVLWPDDPQVLSTDHERAFLVENAVEMEEWFTGGAPSFTSEAWWAWFHDPEPLEEEAR